MMKLHRSETNKLLGGVCGGLGESLGIEAIYLRLLFVFFAFYVGNGLLVYLILWIILPVQFVDTPADQRRLYRSRSDRLVSGVCGGLAQNLNADPSIIRLAFAGLTLFGGGGILIYLLLWITMPEEPFYT